MGPNEESVYGSIQCGIKCLCWNWQHSADSSNWKRRTATFTV